MRYIILPDQHSLDIAFALMNHQPTIFVIFLLGFLFLSGCQKPAEIRQYEIPKERSDLGDIGLKPLFPPKSDASASVPSRMVVAIFESDDATWFFKLTGPIEAVKKTESQWKELFSKIQFDESGKPEWKTPENWNLGPAKPMRFATLTTKVDAGDVELSISSLGPNQNLLDNVNRWRGQLDLEPITKDELKLERLESTSGELKIFDETGGLKTSSSMQPPPSPPTAEFTFEKPDGWVEGSTNEIVKVRLKKGEERTSPQITVTQLLASANDWIPNAQRWARQVDIDDSEENVKKYSSKVSVSGIEGDKIRLIPEDEEKEFAMVGVMIVRDELAWFFKMIGDRKPVADLEKDFDQFVDSFQFK